MSKRLQVILEDGEFRALRAAARRHGMPVSEWVRRALREAHRREPRRNAEQKLRAVEAAMRHDAPTADIERMLGEIEQGYLEPLPD
jgi:hypothetical protein